ncbi:DUF2851 family protein [Chryseobacterium daecheongense]|uniref:DUF2851 family protein n=1 Tax=Chryseobacterium daecheongense TaxID=192389 RepID=UPI001FD68560|nr:DUF2851 family protein [Chryseobacterium daecheongense]UOU98862.1 DUF2851 family protein [Chryseobacterium daecheongense]
MTEKLLQYLWNHKVFNNFDFKDIEGNPVEILDFGQWNTNAGPDFLLAKVKINGLILAGNIELHIKSSDWVFHHHSGDPNYENIILHVVFHHDMEIDDLKNNSIPTLELKNHIDQQLLLQYEKLVNGNHFIPCEPTFDNNKLPVNFHEENIIKKLDEKSVELEKSLEKYKNNFEAVLFHNFAYSFGLKVNAFTFKQIAESIDFSIINKIRQNRTQLEALLFGISGWLDFPEDEPMKIWKREFDFLTIKFKISDLRFHPKFLRLRPHNFPTLRLSQLADLYGQQHLFSKVIDAKNTDDLMKIFTKVKASDYWKDHFNFGKPTQKSQEKLLSKDFIDLIILNAILPLKYTYHKYHREDITDKIMHFYRSIPAEKNSIVESWKKLGLTVTTALESQSLIYHYSHACKEKNCLNCSIGFKLLKESSDA